MRAATDNHLPAIFIRAFDGTKELTDVFIKRLTYTHDEEGDDTCELQIETGQRDLADHPMLQEDKVWTVVWGYIGGDQRKRKIKLMDVEWDYTNTITARIKGTELGSALKSQASKRVFTNTNILDVAQTAADENGLTVVFDANLFADAMIASQPTEARREAMIRDVERAKRNAELQRWNNLTEEEKKVLKHLNEVNKKANEALAKETDLSKLPTVDQEQLKRDLQRKYGKNNPFAAVKQYEAVPQAGKTTKQLLTELGAKEPGGKVIAETRDDKIIIRRRNFKQLPYKTYSYGGDDSDLIAFKPEHKNRDTSSEALDYQGWEKDKKQFHQGTVDAMSSEGGVVMNKMLEVQQKLNALSPDGLKKSFTIPGTFKGVLASNNQSVLFQQEAPISDNTRTYKIFNGISSLSDQKDYIDRFLNPKVNNPEANSPIDSFNNAENLRQTGELEKNPATFKMQGDPLLDVGRLITIISVARKHMGNYYVSKITDEIDMTSGYTTSGEGFRNGSNIKLKPNQFDASTAKKTVNNTQGPEVASKSKVRVKIKKNE